MEKPLRSFRARALAAAVLLLLLVDSAAATLLCPSGVTLQVLIDLGACVIDDKVFSGFAIAPGTFDGLSQLDFAASSVGVAVDSAPLDPGLVFSFNPPLAIGRDQLLLGSINFTVTVSPGGSPIDGFVLTDAATAQGVGFAGVGVTLDNSNFASILTNVPQGTQVCLNASGCVAGTVATLAFAPVTTLGFASTIVLNDNASSAPDPQGATLSSFTVHFTEGATVPEPGTLALLMLGLGALGWARRRA